MPNYKIHIAFGVVFTTLVYFLAKYWEVLQWDDLKLLLYLPLVILTSQLPDLDSKTSIITSLAIWFGFIMILCCVGLYIILQEVILLIIAGVIISMLILSRLFKHRGKLHTILGGLIILAPLLFISIHLYWIGLVAFISHLVLDGKLAFW